MTENRDKKKVPEKKVLDFDYCPRHRREYPKGSTCPECDRERREKN